MVSAAVLDHKSSDLFVASAVFLGLFIVTIVIVAFGTYLYVITTAKATKDVKAQIFRIYVNKSLEASVNAHSGESIATINTDASKATEAFSDAITPFLSCFIAIIAAATVVFAIDYRLGLASVFIGGLALFIQSRFAGRLGKLGLEQLETNSRSVKSISNIFSGGLTIRAFCIQERVLVSYDAENRQLRNLSLKSAFISMWQDMFTTVQGWLTLCITFALGGWLVATEQLSFPMLLMAPAMSMAIADGLSGIGTAWAGLHAPAAAAERVFAILETGIDKKECTEKQLIDGGKYTIAVNNLSFKYLAAEENTLSGIDLKIEENEMVAFVGPSGSGKSTLLRIIIGMYDREGIDIRLGDEKISESDPVSWRKQFAYVDQSCKVFDLSIAENIALGCGDAASRELIEKAAIRASADVFINEIPERYEAHCGEKGASLSGGQKQRIAIARALCRKAPVLVFDEATSALDAESEKKIMETIKSLRNDHTVLITSHSLQNIVDADRIVVMDNGRIVEEGTHKELMEKSSFYYTLFSSASVSTN